MTSVTILVDKGGFNETFFKKKSCVTLSFTQYTVNGEQCSNSHWIQSCATIHTTNLERFHKRSALTLTFRTPSIPVCHLPGLGQLSVLLQPPVNHSEMKGVKGARLSTPTVQLYQHSCH